MTLRKDLAGDLIEVTPELHDLKQYREYASRLSKFGTNYQGMLIHGKLYPSFKIAGAESGRFTSSNPNFQQQPRTGFKNIYLAPEGCSFVTGDLSQIELRTAALLSKDPVMTQAYEDGRDLHMEMAMLMTGKLESEVTKNERALAKGVNFGLLFGGGAMIRDLDSGETKPTPFSNFLWMKSAHKSTADRFLGN